MSYTWMPYDPGIDPGAPRENRRATQMKGYRTIIIGLAMVILPPALTYLAGVDWEAIVGPNTAFVISGAITVAMRVFTTTPLGKK